MSDFCNKCIVEIFDEDTPPDIDVYKIHESLEPGYAEFIGICEGCGLLAVGKKEDGTLIILYKSDEDSEDWKEYE